jgi:hypothetical protein
MKKFQTKATTAGISLAPNSDHKAQARWAMDNRKSDSGEAKSHKTKKQKLRAKWYQFRICIRQALNLPSPEDRSRPSGIWWANDE